MENLLVFRAHLLAWDSLQTPHTIHPWVTGSLWITGSIHTGQERGFIRSFVKQIFIEHCVPETWRVAVKKKQTQMSVLSWS